MDSETKATGTAEIRKDFSVMGKYQDFLQRHPEARDFIRLYGLLVDAGLPIYFNAECDYDLEELEALAREDGGSIWDDFDLLIETQTGKLMDGNAPVTAIFDGTDFLVTDAVSGTEHRNLTPEEAFGIFRKYFDRNNF